MPIKLSWLDYLSESYKRSRQTSQDTQTPAVLLTFLIPCHIHIAEDEEEIGSQCNALRAQSLSFLLLLQVWFVGVASLVSLTVFSLLQFHSMITLFKTLKHLLQWQTRGKALKETKEATPTNQTCRRRRKDNDWALNALH